MQILLLLQRLAYDTLFPFCVKENLVWSNCLIVQTLALTHPTSRIMKGDGNCGWRGMIQFLGLSSIID